MQIINLKILNILEKHEKPFLPIRKRDDFKLDS